MAEIFPDVGIDYIMQYWPKGGGAAEQLKLRLFSSHTATTVITSGQGTANITESAWTNYVPVTLGTATWGAQAAGSPNGRKTTYPQVTMGTCGAASGTINGAYITDNGGGTVVCMMNFDDLTAVPLQPNDIIRVTPTLNFGS